MPGSTRRSKRAAGSADLDVGTSGDTSACDCRSASICIAERSRQLLGHVPGMDGAAPESDPKSVSNIGPLVPIDLPQGDLRKTDA